MKLQKTVSDNDEITESGQATAEQLEKIHEFTRRALSATETFVFPVILCDNEVDRDFERFPTDSLETLSALFLGKTGVFDHNAKAENQSARVFDTKIVVSDDRVNAVGEAYAVLQAWAYMVRCEKNNSLILEIDAGIKKEVSVGCAVSRTECSICGTDVKVQGCVHQKGKIYENVLCHHLLIDPTDAYEWSFVAVPAQKNAGVIKRYREDASAFFEVDSSEHISLEKWMGAPAGDWLSISAEQHGVLAKEYRALTQLAVAGEAYLTELRQSVVKLVLLSHKELDPLVIGAVAAKLNIAELRSMKKAFAATAGKRSAVQTVPTPQTARVLNQKYDNNVVTQFKI